MKYCSKCGKELDDEAVVCTNCGCAVPNKNNVSNASGIQTAAKVFMIIGIVATAFFYLIPLAWTIPMTIYYFNKCNNGEKVGVGFKICSLLFVSLIAGILMLVDQE